MIIGNFITDFLPFITYVMPIIYEKSMSIKLEWTLLYFGTNKAVKIIEVFFDSHDNQTSQEIY